MLESPLLETLFVKSKKGAGGSDWQPNLLNCLLPFLALFKEFWRDFLGGTTSGSLGCLAARADLDVLLGVGATSGTTSGSLTSGSEAAFADLEVLLGVSAGSASLMASSTGSSMASGTASGSWFLWFLVSVQFL